MTPVVTPGAVRSVLRGQAYGRPATLEIADTTLTWRATRGDPAVAENVVTTVHDVRAAHATTRRIAPEALAGAALGALGAGTGHLIPALVAGLVAAAAAGWRLAHPRHALALDLGAERMLVLALSPASAPGARTLAARITAAHAPGAPAAAPPMLP